MFTPAPLDPSRAAALQRSLGGPDLAPLRKRIVDLLRRGRPLDNATTLRHLTAPQRSAIERLIGKAPRSGDPARPLRLDLGSLSAQLAAAGLAPDLRHAVEAIEGPVDDERSAAITSERTWADVLARHPEHAAWLNQAESKGLLKRFAQRNPQTGHDLLTQTSRVLSQLPHPGTTRPVLAAQTLGNAHALDVGKPVATLVTRALRQLDPLATTDHDAWESAGVFHNDLTRTVLALNLPAHGDTWLARLLKLHADAHQPVHLTLRQLRNATPDVFTGINDVYACENPAIVGAAAGLKHPTPPLICVSGQPGSAVHRLFNLLTQAGATLHYHGDFDAYGIAIAARLHTIHATNPWRYTSADYRQALTADRGFRRKKKKRFKPVPLTPWDPNLQQAMNDAQEDLHEEAVLDTLLEDLKQ